MNRDRASLVVCEPGCTCASCVIKSGDAADNTASVCRGCYCAVSNAGDLCFRCTRTPLPPNALDRGDTMECMACDTTVCVFHATQTQLNRQLCRECMHGSSQHFPEGDNDEEGGRDSDVESDSSGGGSWDNDDESDDHDFDGLHGALAESFSQAPVAKRRRLDPDNTLGVPVLVAPADSACSICLQTYDDSAPAVALPCHSSHIFHKGCIDRWMHEESGTCPLCFADFT